MFLFINFYESRKVRNTFILKVKLWFASERMNYRLYIFVVVYLNVSFMFSIHKYLNDKNALLSSKIAINQSNLVKHSEIPTNRINHLCQIKPLLVDNEDAIKTIESESKELSSRFEECSNPTFNIDSLVEVVRHDVMFEPVENLTLILNMTSIKTNFGLKKTDQLECSSQRFDKWINITERRNSIENLGSEIVFEEVKNYQIVVNESGFFYVKCWLEKRQNGIFANIYNFIRDLFVKSEFKNKTNERKQIKVFDHVYNVLPTDMQRLVLKRGEFKRTVSQFIDNFKFGLDMVNEKFKNDFINDDCPLCERPNEKQGNFSKANVLMIGIDSVSQQHFERLYPLTFKFLTHDMSDSLRYS